MATPNQVSRQPHRPDVLAAQLYDHPDRVMKEWAAGVPDLLGDEFGQSRPRDREEGLGRGVLVVVEGLEVEARKSVPAHRRPRASPKTSHQKRVFGKSRSEDGRSRIRPTIPRLGSRWRPIATSAPSTEAAARMRGQVAGRRNRRISLRSIHEHSTRSAVASTTAGVTRASARTRVEAIRAACRSPPVPYRTTTPPGTAHWAARIVNTANTTPIVVRPPQRAQSANLSAGS